MNNWLINPYMLVGLATAAIPIIIELLFRLRRRRIEFPAMRYLMNPRKRKRVRLQDRILLLVRMALLALLAVALARPLLRPDSSGSADQPTRNVIIVLDGTYSMGQSVGQTTAFEVAQTMSQDIVRGLPKDAKISLVVLDHRANVNREKVTDHDSVHDAIGRARVSDMSGRMPDAIEVVEKLLQENTGLPPELYIVGDMQRSTWSPTPQDNRDAAAMLAELSNRCDTFVLDTGGRSGFNAFVTRFEPEEKVMAVGMESRFEVDIQATNMPANATLLVTMLADENTNPTREPGNGPSEDPSLALRVGERKIAAKELASSDLQDGRATLDFRHTFVEPGEHLLRVELSGDRLATDNRRYYLATVPEDVKVLVVDSQADSDSSAGEVTSATHLIGAIAPTTPPGFDRLARYAVTVQNPAGVFDLNLDEFGVVVLANVGNLANSLTKRLEQYVADGGRLMIFVGDAVKPYEYNTKLLNGGKGLLPCELTDAVGISPRDASVRSAEGNGESQDVLFDLVYSGVGSSPHPAVANMRQMTKTAAPPSISRYMPVKLSSKQQQFGTPIAFLSNNQPAICERSFGQGKVVLVNTSADDSWNFLAYTTEYAVLMHELLGWMIGDPDKSVNLEIGQSFEQPVLLSSQYLLLRRPDYSKVRLAPVEAPEGDIWRVSFGDTVAQGVYEVDTIPEVLNRRRFVVNMVATEGDLTRLDADDVGQQISAAGGTYCGPETAITRQVESRYSVTEFAWAVLWLVFGLLATETFLARRFGQRRI